MPETMQMPEPEAPNTGRILDYWLGGEHHFPADVAAAQAFESIYAGWPALFRVLRDYIGRASRFVHAQGVDQFLVLGAGIPAQGNVHEAVPDARVLYTDLDPVNVELGRRILAGRSGVGYTSCDAADLSTLDREEMERTLGPLRRLGTVFVGVSVFLTDEQLRGTLDALWELSPPGSYVVLDFDSDFPRTLPGVIEALTAGGAPYCPRTPEDIPPLLGRWQLTPDGIQTAALWRNAGPTPDVPAFSYVAVLTKN